MKLTRDQRKAFFAGEFPRITHPGDKPCPVEAGETYRLSKLQRLEVTRIRRSRKGEWVVVYEVHRLAGPLYLATSAPRINKLEDRDNFTVEQARGYTRSRSRSLDPEAECIDLDDLERIRTGNKERGELYELQRAADLLAACEEVRAAADAMDPELKKSISRELWTLKGRIDALERKLRRKAAA